MIIDAHYHLEPRMQPMDDLLKQMDRSGVDRVALIAAMCDPLPWGTLVETGTATMRTLLLGPSPLASRGREFYAGLVTEDGKFVVMGKHYAIYDLPDNATVAQAMQAHPDRFWGWIFVNPRAADPQPEWEKWVGAGWVGVKAHPFMHRYPVAALDKVAAFCTDERYPLLIHLGGERDSGNYRLLPDKYPSLQIIYAHAGLPFFGELWDYARDRNHIYVDFSSPGYVDSHVQSAALKVLGAERCLFGTDGPYCDADHGKMIEQISRLHISQAEQDCILGGNLLGLIAYRAGHN